MCAMKSQNVSRVVLASGAAAVLAATALLYLPEFLDRDAPPRPPGPAERAATAAHAGAPAALPDLVALIGDRERWLAEHPDDAAAWAVLAAAYTERGTRLGDARDLPRAERALDRSLAALPAARGNVDAQLGLGVLAGARGDWKGAKEWGERVRAATPRRWNTYPLLIDAYNGLGDYPAARKAMESLEKLYGGPVVRGRAAQVYRDRGWREDADATALDAAALAATDAERAAAHSRLGQFAWERGEPAEALERYGTALRFVRDHGPALAGRARALAALGRTEEAQRDWRAALARQPLPEYVLESGELAEALGLDGDARAAYGRLREGRWASPSTEVVLGLLDADHGDPGAAVVRLRAAWAKGHRSVAVADALGWALYRAGEPEEALPYARRATDEGLRSAAYTYHLGEIERALGRTGPARRHLEEALRIHPSFSPLHAPRAEAALAGLGEPDPAAVPKDALPEGGAPKGARKDGAPKPGAATEAEAA
ncbi:MULTISPECIES: tetratricopeptide repeat protein [Streptomyces]|uniref:Tetratricopeptide repeat protein n=2 Tax=Streptomyces TaxID=1883 RepID=A0ABU4K587_9ACTN|nr:tetratricopeptide repeat protein [Streptomyces roseolus]MDX2292898.1 tetratricopeptide repeat protein [Streptomyces roseolus]